MGVSRFWCNPELIFLSIKLRVVMRWASVIRTEVSDGGDASPPRYMQHSNSLKSDERKYRFSPSLFLSLPLLPPEEKSRANEPITLFSWKCFKGRLPLRKKIVGNFFSILLTVS